MLGHMGAEVGWIDKERATPFPKILDPDHLDLLGTALAEEDVGQTSGLQHAADLRQVEVDFLERVEMLENDEAENKVDPGGGDLLDLFAAEQFVVADALGAQEFLGAAEGVMDVDADHLSKRPAGRNEKPPASEADFKTRLLAEVIKSGEPAESLAPVGLSPFHRLLDRLGPVKPTVELDFGLCPGRPLDPGFPDIDWTCEKLAKLAKQIFHG